MTRSETIQEIFNLMGRMKRTMHNQFQSAYEALGLSPTQLDILMSIYHSQPISHKALAAKLQLTPGAVSQLLDGLDEADCIVRTADPSDRRVSYLSISRGGKRKLDSSHALRQQLFTDAFSQLNDEELTSYLRAQEKMLTWFEAQQATNKQKEQ